MVKRLEVGEIFKVNNKEFILISVKKNNGREFFPVLMVKRLDKTILNDFRKQDRLKKFKGIKLTRGFYGKN